MFFPYLVVYVLSGFAFLSAEVILIREMGLRTGSTPLSAAWILSVFFLFGALGAKLGGRLAVGRVVSARRYGLAELGIGVSLLLLYSVREWVFAAAFQGMPWERAYALWLAAIPSLLSGMTLPLLGEALDLGGRSRRANWLYAGNLFGAALGIALGGVYLPWKLGYQMTIYIVVGLFVFVAVVAILVSRKLAGLSSVLPAQATIESPKETLPAAWVGWVMVMSGVLTLATEILAIGYFQIIAEESIYSYSAVFLVFILGLSLGALIAAVARPSLIAVLSVTATLMLVTPIFLQWIFLRREVMADPNEWVYYTRLVLLASLVLLPLLMAQGAVFPLAWAYWRERVSTGNALGRYLLLNKLGSAVGVLVAGYCLVRFLGYPGAFLLLGGLYALLVVVGLWLVKATRARLGMHGGVMLVAAVLGAWFSHEPIDLQEGETLRSVYHGKTDLVTVVDDALGSRHIRINQAYTLNGTDRALRSQQMEGWLPCVLSPDPKRVLFIGMASGISAGSVLDFPVEELAAVELSPQVVDAARDHFAEWNAELFADSRAKIVVDDGRHVIPQMGDWDGWDLIVSDLFNPVRAGASQLHSEDFFRLGSEHLAEEGLMVSWIPAYQFDEEMLSSTMRAFANAFDHAILVRANLDPFQPIIGLVGSNQPIQFSPRYLGERLAALPESVRAEQILWFRDTQNLSLVFMGDLKGDGVTSYLADRRANTDDWPLLAFRGPRRFEAGELMRGTNILNWGGELLLSESAPSLVMGDMTAQEQSQYQRASNHLYAAAAMSVPIPGASAEKNQARQQRMLHHLRVAYDLAGVRVSMDDLGQ